MKNERGAAYDLIFVLAGRVSRKLYAIREFEKGTATRLLLSTARFELRKFPQLPITPKPDLLALATNIPAPERHCFVVYPPGAQQVTWVKVGRYGTMSEIAGLAEWLKHRTDIRRILVISSASHLKRVELCCKRFLPASIECSFRSVPGESSTVWEELKEAGKRLVYLGAFRIRREIDF